MKLGTVSAPISLASLSDVDAANIGMTGRSRRNADLSPRAVDDRVKVSVPVVMVSLSLLRRLQLRKRMLIQRAIVTTPAMPKSRLFTPHPLLIISDGNDWTKNVLQVEFPYVQRTGHTGKLIKWRTFTCRQKVDYALPRLGTYAFSQCILP